jgi:hypothetical protein
LLYQRWGVRANAQAEEILALAERKWEPKRILQLQDLLQRLELNRSSAAYSAKHFVDDSHAIAEIVEAIKKE